MTADSQAVVRSALRQLRELSRVIEPAADKQDAVDESVGRYVQRALEPARESVPELPPFDDGELGFFRGAYGDGSYFQGRILLAYVVNCLAILEGHAESDSPPAVQPPELGFMRTRELRREAEGDYREILACHATHSWKAAIMLTGSCLEAILLDLVLQREEEAKKLTAAPKGSPASWNLADLVEVCEALDLISKGQISLSDAVREFRNLVHPGRIMRKGLRFGREEAVIGLETLNALVRDLS